jgi:hypothetical protein
MGAVQLFTELADDLSLKTLKKGSAQRLQVFSGFNIPP